MNLVQEVHQAHFFTNNQDVTATPPIVSALMNAIGQFNLIPNMGQEINAGTGERRQFPTMISPDQSLRVEFPINEVVIVGSGKDQEEFSAQAIGIFEALAQVFPEKTGHRLSMLNTKIYRDDEQTYDSLYNQLFTHHDATPFEWDNRIVEKRQLPTSGETINSISAVRRCEIKASGSGPMDCIVFELDSNTVHQNTNARFTLKDSSKVFKELKDNNLSLSEQLKRYTD